jgi:CsoR family transcriptional regulator, copper-sensing transcriptional repressor
MTYAYHHKKNELQKRLVRIEGQVRGVNKMVSSDEYCIDVLTQIRAVQSALDKVALELLRDHAKQCLTNPDISVKHGNDKADELVKAISRML